MSRQQHEIMTSSRPGGVMEEVLFLWLMRAVAMGGGRLSPSPTGKLGTAGTVVRQTGSQETKYPNFSLLPPSYLLPLAKPEARGPRHLVMKTSEVSLAPWKAQIRGPKDREQNLGWGANGEASENMMNPACPWFRRGALGI